MQKLEEAYKVLQGQDGVLSRTLRITAPEDFGWKVVSPAIGKLALSHPQLSYELQYTDKIVDLVKDGFDIAVRVGAISQSGFKVKKLGEIVLYVVASPEYLA